MYESIPHLITQPPDTASTVTLRGWPGFWASGASAKKDLFRISVHICICAVVVVFIPGPPVPMGGGSSAAQTLQEDVFQTIYKYVYWCTCIHIM